MTEAVPAENEVVINSAASLAQEAVAAEAPIAPPEAATDDVMPLSLASQVEALLYASGEPATLAALAGALDATNGEIEAALEELTALYAVRGIRLQRSGNKVQLVTAPEIASKVQKFLGLEEVNRLSPAALETLAIIAYNQPITRPQMEMIRGVNCDGVITTLMARNLIQELGRADSVGHPMRYGVSFEFLQYFGLRNVHELPPVEKLDTLPIRVENAPNSNAILSWIVMLLPMLRDEGREKHGRILRELATLVEAGKVRPLLDPHRFDLAHAADAHRHLESGKAVGKVVVEIA